jgi:hypothetical protein
MLCWVLATYDNALRIQCTRQRCQLALNTRRIAAFNPSCASVITNFKPRRPRRARLLRNPDQNVSASDGPICSPTISRLPSVFTATAIIAATQTCDLLIPLSPIACTNSSTRRVETPPIYASWITPISAFSETFRASRNDGKKLPCRNFRDPQLKRPQPGVEHPFAVTVAPGRALTTALVVPRTDQTIDISLRQQLQHRPRHGSQEIAVTGLQQLGQRQSLLGHRILSRSWLKLRNSTLADRSDGHPRLHRNAISGVAPNLHHVRGR